ncbi:NAD(P)H-hydrate dehydratase [Denitratisoma sp. agr-D3]
MTTETTPLLLSPDLRAIEAEHAALPLMERAGAAACALALRLQQSLTGPPLILVGPGNNGGDGLVLARLLRQAGVDPCVVSVADPDRLPADAAKAWRAWQESGGSVHTEVPAGNFGLVVDALFGIGLKRPAEGTYQDWIEAINGYGGPVLALDCPSGLDADTGATLGATVHASHTVSFIAGKPGLYTLEGPDHCGTVTIDDLGLATTVRHRQPGVLLDAASGIAALRPFLPQRRRNSHKGSYGSVGIVGGAAGMAGAALLAGTAALKLGAGRVYVGMLERLALSDRQPELMLRPAREAIELATALAVGPGLGGSAEAVELLRLAIAANKPLLLDADGLNLLAAHPAWHRPLAQRRAPTLLTPHPLEAARLLAQNVAAVQADRVAATRLLARRFQAHVVLKGAGSVIAHPDGRWAVNASGNPGLASAGSGDVLSGMAAALLAQGVPGGEALALAVHLHGLAADRCVADGQGSLGLTASELPDAARAQINQWLGEGT